MLKKPFISWIIPVSHSEIWLSRCLNSIQNQTYENWEALIIFNNVKNKYEYKKIINEFKNDNRFIFLNFNTIGITPSLNYGLKKSRGEFIARIDADDYAINTRLEKQIMYLSNDFIFSNVYYVDIDNKKIGKSSIPENYIFKFNYTNTIPHPSVLINKKVLLSVGGYDGIAVCQDLRTWDKLIKNKCKFFLINDALTFTTIKADRITGSKESRYQAAKFYFYKFIREFNLLSLIGFINNSIKYIYK